MKGPNIYGLLCYDNDDDENFYSGAGNTRQTRVAWNWNLQVIADA